MITDTHHVRFEFVIDPALINVQLEADVDEHHSKPFFVAKNIRVSGRGDRAILPDISIEKVKGRWVHTDSGKETQLSQAVGLAIDALKNFARGAPI